MRLLEPGSTVELLATDAGSVEDVAAWCRTTGNILVEQTADGALYRFVIRRK
jgi:tRNA 2-thiouridine synthesizing protein A